MGKSEQPCTHRSGSTLCSMAASIAVTAAVNCGSASSSARDVDGAARRGVAAVGALVSISPCVMCCGAPRITTCETAPHHVTGQSDTNARQKPLYWAMSRRPWIFWMCFTAARRITLQCEPMNILACVLCNGQKGSSPDVLAVGWIHIVQLQNLAKQHFL